MAGKPTKPTPTIAAPDTERPPPLSLDKLRSHAGTLASVYQMLPVQSVVENGTSQLISPPADKVVLARQFIEGLYADLAQAIAAAEQDGTAAEPQPADMDGDEQSQRLN